LSLDGIEIEKSERIKAAQEYPAIRASIIKEQNIEIGNRIVLIMIDIILDKTVETSKDEITFFLLRI
jgi:hypothetical protein